VEQARAVLEGLGFDPARIRLVEGQQLPGTLEGAPPPAVPAAGFAALGGKREILRLALDHLHGQAPEAVDWAPLPEGAAFGEVRVDGDACTLCMACVSTCPAGALLDGEDRPQVRFLEGNCVQCGLCESACPEDAVTLFPRMAYVPSLHKQARVLHEEEPFHCIGCGKPFATRSMVDRMAEKLVSHWMYRDSDAMVRRLQMCGDCRVKDLFAQEGGLDVHGKG
jgi:ferredoxin